MLFHSFCDSGVLESLCRLFGSIVHFISFAAERSIAYHLQPKLTEFESKRCSFLCNFRSFFCFQLGPSWTFRGLSFSFVPNIILKMVSFAALPTWIEKSTLLMLSCCIFFFHSFHDDPVMNSILTPFLIKNECHTSADNRVGICIPKATCLGTGGIVTGNCGFLSTCCICKSNTDNESYTQICLYIFCMLRDETR